MPKPSNQPLNVNDLLSLAQDPSSNTRAALAMKIGQRMEEATQSEREYQLTLDIAYLLARDKQRDVRMAMADGIKTSNHTPMDMLLELAHDADPEVAARILQHSHRIQDEELMAIIQATQQVVRLLAIARRNQVSVQVVGALVERKIHEVCHALLENTGAEIDDKHYHHIADEFYDSDDIMQAFMKRHPIPAKAVKHMVERSTSMSKERIVAKRERQMFEHDEVDPGILEDLDRVMALGNVPNDVKCSELADYFNREGALSPIFLAAILMLGNHRLFMSCMAVRSKMDMKKVADLYTGNYHSFRQFYDMSRLPYGMHRLFWHLKCCVDEIVDMKLQPNSYEFFTTASQMLDIADMECIPYTNRVGYAAAKILMNYFVSKQN